MTDAFAHKKSLGQHFLNSPVVPGWLCTAAGDIANKLVLEIGPGTGALTKELLARGATVLALEADPRAVASLEETFKAQIESGKLTVFHTDVRTLDLETFSLKSGQFQVIANIPYYLTGYLFRTLLEQPILPNQLVFLVQKEVAKRATSNLERGEKESLLSLSLQLYGTPEYVRSVSKGHFTPAPKVDSAIIALRNIHPLPEAAHSAEHIFTLLHLGFGQKRKQLQGNLQATYSKETIIKAFAATDIPPTARAEDLPLSKWLSLADFLFRAAS